MLRFIPRQRSYVGGGDIVCSLFNLLSSKATSQYGVENLEKKLSGYLGAEEILIYPSLRLSLHDALRYYGVGDRDEIILPSYTYPGYLSVLKSLGCKLKFVDLDQTLNISVDDLIGSVTRKTKAILVPHHYGNPADIGEIRRNIRKDILIIEDATQSFGADFLGKKAGAMGDIGLISFSRGKYMDLMGGCAVTCRDKMLMKHLRKRNNCFSFPKRVEFLKKILVYAYIYISSSTFMSKITTLPFLRLTSSFNKQDKVPKIIRFLFSEKQDLARFENEKFNDVQAELGLRRLRIVKKIIESQRKNAQHYYKNLRIDDIMLPQAKGRGSYLYFPILSERRNRLASYLLKHGIDSKRNFHKLLSGDTGKFPRSAKTSGSILHIPVFYGLKEKDLDYITEKINSFHQTSKTAYR